MKQLFQILAAVVVLSNTSRAGEPPAFKTDAEIDAWLRKNSAFYAVMAVDIDKRGGYSFRSWSEPLGVVVTEEGRRFIQLNPSLEGAERVSILIFEVTNAYQEEHHQEIDTRARTGAIDNPIEFGLLHELVEFDGLRYHRKVLVDLDRVLKGIPRPMLTWINPALTSLETYELPLAFTFVEAQARSGHTDHYRKWFWIQRGWGSKDRCNASDE
ncbi:MAG: hypothetical protein QOE70_6273 [Chthoniobacter sp.]|jgi:hypothetical protein|nr:hypothetical protein [Chthoniobacter sp.]